MTQRVASLTLEQVREAVHGASSWREVGRRLELRAARDLAAVRTRCDEAGVGAEHLPGPQAEAAFARAVAAAEDWEGLLEQLGYAGSSGSARASVRGRARRLGLDLAHLDLSHRIRADEAQDSLARALGAPRPDLLRSAAPALVAAQLLSRGCAVSWPLEPAPYDLVAEVPGPPARLLRVQVKSTTVREGAGWRADLGRTGHRRRRAGYSSDEVDAFAVVDAEGGVHLLPVALLEGASSVGTASLTEHRLLA